MSNAYGFTEDSARRIARVVKAVEGDTTTPTRIGPKLGGAPMSVVKVTGTESFGNPAAVRFTGISVDYNAEENIYSENNEIIIKDINNAALVEDNYYLSFFGGYTVDDKPLFLVKEISGGSAEITVVTGVTCHPESGLVVSTATFSGASYDNAVIKQFISLTDTPATYLGNQGRVVQVNANATGLTFGPMSNVLAHTFISLTDTPATYSGQGGKFLKVNSGATAVEFASVVSTTFLALTDTPASFSGQGGKFLRVNSAGTALEFVTNYTQYLEDQIADLTARLETLESAHEL